jgi:glycosyltransferase involved in cell wall biosynthesis
MWGGTEHYVVRLAVGLRERGCRVRLLWAHDVVGDRVREAGLDGRRLRLRGDADLAGLVRLAADLRRHRTEVLLTTKWREYLLGGLAARLAGVRRHVVSLGLRVAPRDDPKRRLIFRLADRVIVNADEIRAALLEAPWIRPDAVTVVHNGVDLERFAAPADGAAFRRELDIPPTAPLLLNVGALTPQKDQATLLRAAARLRISHPEAYVAVVGEGFLRDDLAALAQELGVADRVRLAGFRTDVRPALAAADLFVLSSDNEGMPWVLLEALAAGRPIVATDVSGTRACVEDGVNGRIVPPSAPDALAAACAALIDDPATRVRMGAAARTIAAERFDVERLVDQTLALLTP